jgi:glycosyltransferase involved in cell wall biosynthesis
MIDERKANPDGKPGDVTASPKISVCIPCYNHAKYLPITLDSILNQTYRSFEIILVDDRSPDESLVIARGYESQYPTRVHVYTHPGGVNRGYSDTCNLAMEMASGEYFAWLGSDDAWYPTKLEAQVNLLQKQPQMDMVYGLADIITSDGQKSGEQVGRDITSSPLFYLLAGNFIPALTMLHHRRCTEKLGAYDPALLYSDWEMWLRFVSHFKIAFLNQSLGMYRVHDRNLFAGRAIQEQRRHDIAVLEKICRSADQIGGLLTQPEYRAMAKLRLASVLFDFGDKEGAARWVDEALEIDRGLNEEIPRLIHILDVFRCHLDFYSLVCSHLPARNPKKQREFTANYLARAASFYRESDLKQARTMAVNCIGNDPRWLSNPKLLAVIVESILGARTYSSIRSGLRKAHLIPPPGNAIKSPPLE